MGFCFHKSPVQGLGLKASLKGIPNWWAEPENTGIIGIRETSPDRLSPHSPIFPPLGVLTSAWGGKKDRHECGLNSSVTCARAERREVSVRIKEGITDPWKNSEFSQEKPKCKRVSHWQLWEWNPLAVVPQEHSYLPASHWLFTCLGLDSELWTFHLVGS